ncbi:polysaccharide deacetylase family protein [Sphingomonas hylomeconis]|uniref:Polysaccharide deacetylase family protein n=1 Tax=Sphingomonas hylomeconis TaxID=1395958 RepID=A0ABV7SYG4_9SPHN|nr:polysaccharide deacetylase family protein [Sphingomonas hylomeconis]
MTPVLLTVDTELAWRHHAAGLDPAALFDRSIEPAGVGIAYQLAVLARHRLKACFFVDPLPALLFGPAPMQRVVEAILAAGQEVQLHLHPNWTGATAGDRGASHGRFELIDFSQNEQRDLIARARDLLVAAGAPLPVAFRAGSYSANDATLRALAALGFRYDSSHNGAEHPWPSAIGLPATQIAPVRHEGLIEVPVTLIHDRPGRARNFQICALSGGEMAAALDHAAAQGHAAVTIVSHSFELANRAGTRRNNVHVRRFEALCALLATRRAVLPTAHFADVDLALDQVDVPLAPSALRTGWRYAEQAWSNLIEERAR